MKIKPIILWGSSFARCSGAQLDVEDITTASPDYGPYYGGYGGGPYYGSPVQLQSQLATGHTMSWPRLLVWKSVLRLETRSLDESGTAGKSGFHGHYVVRGY